MTRRKKRRAQVNGRATPERVTAETGQVITVEGVTVEDVTAEDVAAVDAPLVSGELADVDDLVAAVVAADPDGPTLEPEDAGDTSDALDVGVGAFFEALEDAASAFERAAGDVLAVGRECVRLTWLIARVLGREPDELRDSCRFEVFPTEEADPQRVCCLLRTQSGEQVMITARADRLLAVLRGILPGAGLGALVDALWHEQQALELGRQLSGDPGQE